MDPKHAAIIARQMYRIYAHAVLGGVYEPVDYGDLETLQAKASLLRAKKATMSIVLRAMSAKAPIRKSIGRMKWGGSTEKEGIEGSSNNRLQIRFPSPRCTPF
jgi:hypothetical protein